MTVFGKRSVPARAGVWIAGALALPLLALGAFLCDLQLSGNFHTVVPGEFYRAAQPTPRQLQEYADKYGVKSVINLRGPHDGFTWYEAEKAENAKLGIKQIDFRVSSITEMDSKEIARLVAIMRQARKPLLVHCQSGADRSGLVSALYLAAINGVDIKEAARQLSIRYGHFSMPFSRTYAMDLTLQAFGASSAQPSS